MRYVTLNDFGDSLGTQEEAWLKAHSDAEALLSDCESRVLAYIIPNIPACDEQVGAFCRAVYAQLRYETSDQNAQFDDMPDKLTAFTVNGFSGTFSGGMGDSASRVGLCREARAELLLAGLLFRGVQCTC